MRQVLADAINRMPDRERLVLTLYYYEGLTLAEIGSVLGVTESRVCQIHTKAIFQLRSRLSEPLPERGTRSPDLPDASRPTRRVGLRRTPRICRRVAVGSTSFPFLPRVVVSRRRGGKVRRSSASSSSSSRCSRAAARRGRAAAPIGGWIRPVAGAVVRPFDPPRVALRRRASRRRPRRTAGHAGRRGRAGRRLVRRFRRRHACTSSSPTPASLRTSYSFLADGRGATGRSASSRARSSARRAAPARATRRRRCTSVCDRATPTSTRWRCSDRPTSPAIVHLAPTSRAAARPAAAGERAASLRRRASRARLAAHRGTSPAGGVRRPGAVLAASRSRVDAAVCAGRPRPGWTQRAVVCRARAAGQRRGRLRPPRHGRRRHREQPRARDVPSLGLPARDLGYTADEITYFSYAADAAATDVRDTEGPSSWPRADSPSQLRALQRREPGREVDLIAHSQGGVVVEAFLTQLYDRGDPRIRRSGPSSRSRRRSAARRSPTPRPRSAARAPATTRSAAYPSPHTARCATSLRTRR